MDKRHIAFTLSRPWGAAKFPANLLCFVAYPEDYLGSTLPMFRLDDSAMIEKTSAEALMTDVTSIAFECRTKQRPVLEFVLRYLLGEHDRDGISDLLQTNSGSDLNLLPIDRFDSSDEDDDVDDIDTCGLELNDGAVTSLNATFNVPLPRTCGASWSNAGLLIYYFPKKDDRTLALSGTFDLAGMKKPFKGSANTFTTFGQQNRSSLGRCPLCSVANAADDISTDDGDSSSSSDTSELAFFAGPQFAGHIPWDVGSGMLQQNRQRSIGGSHGSSNGPKLSQSPNVQRSSVMHIDTMQDFFQQSRQLGELYMFSGEHSQCFRHNAHVAESIGRHDLAESWLLLLLISQENFHQEATQSLKDLYAPGAEAPRAPRSFKIRWLIDSLILHYN